MRLSGSCAGLSVIYNEQYFPMTEHIDYENIFTPQGMLALVHDAHEAVIGDILPFFKTAAVKEAIDTIQRDILDAFAIEEDETLHEELKLLDMIGFLYEIGQSSPRGIDPAKRKLIKKMYARQRADILAYTGKAKIENDKVEEFLKSMKL